ncbi:putative dienelactone hydrolase, alpha/Beta hydrolase [Helianthus annuus]|nr:putative dienelactone hydrolase, alpha/Beta hydrolase [Helianthus annuus]
MNEHEKGTQTKAAFIYRECPVIYLMYSFTFFHGRLQFADKVAAAGYYVVVPDFFHGEPLTSITKIGDWLKNMHPLEQAIEFAKPIIQALKEKGITKIGTACFYWGAKVVVELAKDAEIQFVALLHPSFVTIDDIKGMFYSTTFIISHRFLNNKFLELFLFKHLKSGILSFFKRAVNSTFSTLKSRFIFSRIGFAIQKGGCGTTCCPFTCHLFVICYLNILDW